MASVFDTSVDRDQQRADQLLELVKWASGLRGAQYLGNAYSGPIADAYNRTLGHPAMQPGGAIQGATQNLPPVGPFAIAKGLGALPTVLGARGTGLTSGAAGMHGADVFDKLFRKIEMMGRSIAKTQQDIPDVVQAGNEAVVKRMATAKGPGLSGIEATKIARGAEKNYRPANTQAVGSRRVDKRLVEKVEAMMGDQGHDKWVEKLRELDPKGGWTLGRLRDVQSGKPQAVSLDKLKPGKAGEGALGMQLRSDENPELWARVREVAKGLKGAMKRDAEDLIAGRKDASELHPQTLQRLRGAFSEFSPESAKTPAAAKIVSRGGKPLDPETDKVVNWLQDKPIGAAEQLMVEDVKKAPQRSKGFKSKPIPVPKPISGGSDVPTPGMGETEDEMLDRLMAAMDNPKWREAQASQHLQRQMNQLRKTGKPNLSPEETAWLEGGMKGPVPPISGGAGDQFTNPQHPAFGTHALFNVKQQIADPGAAPPVSPRGMLDISNEAKMGPPMEMYFGQGDLRGHEPLPLRTRRYSPGTDRLLVDPYGNDIGGGMGWIAPKDQIMPGPYPKQDLGGFHQLQQMIMDAMFKSGRN